MSSYITLMQGSHVCAHFKTGTQLRSLEFGTEYCFVSSWATAVYLGIFSKVQPFFQAG